MMMFLGGQGSHRGCSGGLGPRWGVGSSCTLSPSFPSTLWEGSWPISSTTHYPCYLHKTWVSASWTPWPSRRERGAVHIKPSVQGHLTPRTYSRSQLCC